MRRSTFLLSGRFDGSDGAKVIVEYQSPERAFVSVRPKGRRRTYDMDFAQIANSIIYDVVKKELMAQGKHVPGPRSLRAPR